MVSIAPARINDFSIWAASRFAIKLAIKSLSNHLISNVWARIYDFLIRAASRFAIKFLIEILSDPMISIARARFIMISRFWQPLALPLSSYSKVNKIRW